jgi:hypothetical protein
MADDRGLKCWAYGTIITKELESINMICHDLKSHAQADGSQFEAEFGVLDARIRHVDSLIDSAKGTCGLPTWVLNGWSSLKKHYEKNKPDKFYEDVGMFTSLLGVEPEKSLK